MRKIQIFNSKENSTKKVHEELSNRVKQEFCYGRCSWQTFTRNEIAANNKLLMESILSWRLCNLILFKGGDRALLLVLRCWLQTTAASLFREMIFHFFMTWGDFISNCGKIFFVMLRNVFLDFLSLYLTKKG